MHYDSSHCDTYEEFCEEIIAYMRCQNETFNFGEGEMSMEDGGEYGMYKFSILQYLNEPYYDESELSKRWKAQRVDKLHRQIEVKFDELSNDKLNRKLHGRYDTNMKYRNRQMKLVKEQFGKRLYVPFYIKTDENDNEYIKYVNVNRSGDTKKKYKRINKSTRSYQHYCEYCEKEIIYDEESLCDSCYSNFEAEGVFVFERQKENEIMWNNDFSEYKVKDGHWWFHDYYDWEEARWNILYMKLN